MLLMKQYSFVQTDPTDRGVVIMTADCQLRGFGFESRKGIFFPLKFEFFLLCSGLGVRFSISH
jgi:hypothetical protein